MINRYGVSERILTEAKAYHDLTLARVTAQHKGGYRIVTKDGDMYAEISGKMRHTLENRALFPAVGDYVMVQYNENTTERQAVIHNILSRTGIFMRDAVGVSGQMQVVAANIDTVFICMSLNQNYNLNRLERYLSMVYDGGATPVVVLTKTDLCEDVEEKLAEVQSVALFADIITTSAFEENVQDKFRQYITEGKTVTFIGSSGVGKSTIINAVMGEELIDTNDVSHMDKGKHTTTAREMYICPFGGVVIDTPGMRGISLDGLDVSETFGDIEELATACKFTDCTHKGEPGCAVQAAVESGDLDERRLASYLKLAKSRTYEGLRGKQKLDVMYKDIGGAKGITKLRRNVKKRKP